MKKSIVSMMLTAIMTVTLLTGVPAGNMMEVQAATTLQNPRRDSNGVVTWDCVYFGNYPQSDATGKTKEPIKWRVLSVDGEDAFLVADTNLDVQRYNDTYDDVTWETCTIRSWLNGYGSGSNVCGTDYNSDNFIDRAFTAAEQDAIITTTVVNADNPSWGTAGGNNTKDKVFLLSFNEVTNPAYGFSSDYATFDNARKRINTAYVAGGGTIGSSNMRSKGSTGRWWLRSPGDNSYYAMYVNGDGYVNQSGFNVSDNRYAACPALHLNLSSSNLWSYAGTVSSDGESTGGEDTPIQTEYDTSTEGVCSAEHISALLGNSAYRNYVGSIRSIDMIIPGIRQTNMGNGTVCNNMVTQGICVTNDYVLISAYCHDEKHNSVIYVMDKNTKKYLTTIVLSVEGNAGLKKGNHVGGLAYGNDTVYIAGSSENKVWKLPYEEVTCAVSTGKDVYSATISGIRNIGYIETTKASYIYWDDSFKELFVGHFDEYKQDKNYMTSYDVNTGKATSSKIRLPLNTQGVTFGMITENQKYCICSKSLGKKNPSQIYVAKLEKVKDARGYVLTNWHCITVPNMSEDIQVWNETLYNCFESAANYYNDGGKKLRSTALDRIPCIGVRSLISSVMKDGESVNIQKLDRYAASETGDVITDNSGILAEGSCGKDVSYCLYNDGSMVISGQGEMENYMEGTAPWSDHNDDITSIYVDCGVTGIGEYAFCNCTNLEEVTVSKFMNPDDTFLIGTNAFVNCSKLSKVELPDIAYDISTNTFDETSHIQIYSNSGSVETYCAGFDNLSLHKHDMKYVATTRATCMEVGYDSYVCDCGYEEVSNVVQATAKHSFVEVEREDATQNEEGYVKYQCSGCADTYYETLEYEESGDKSPGDKSPEDSSGEKKDIPAVGTRITISSSVYKVTKSSATKKEVTYIKPKSSRKTKVTVPSTVKISGYTYKVTGIASNAFAGNKKLTKVTIGKNVTSIGKSAFKKCTKLKYVTIKSTSLKTIGSNAFYGDKNLKTIIIKSKKLTSKSIGKNAFKGTNKKLVIKVPKSKVKSYKKFLTKKGNTKVRVKKG